MITPTLFKESFLQDDDRRFALWFQHTVENAPKKYLFSNSKQCFSVPACDLPSSFLTSCDKLKDTFKRIVYDFGWEVAYSHIVEHNDNSGIKITFYWTDEELDTPENKEELEKQYKYVTFNNVMWKYGHTDMTKFDNWFNKVADEHRNNLSYNELVYKCLIIPYDEIKKADKSFVEDYTCKYGESHYYETYATCSDKELKTSKLKECYNEHLQHLGWGVKSIYFDNNYCLICY